MDVNTIFINEIRLMINDDSVDKILIMLNYLTDMEARCDIIVNLLMYVFPWTDEIKKLALSYRKYSIEIENYIKMEDVFYVFHKYGFQDIIDIYDKRSVRNVNLYFLFFLSTITAYRYYLRQTESFIAINLICWMIFINCAFATLLREMLLLLLQIIFLITSN